MGRTARAAQVSRALWVGIPVLLAGLFFWWASYATTIIVWEGRKLLSWLAAPLLLLAFLLLVGLALKFARGRRDGGGGGGSAGVVLGWLGAVLGLGLGIWWLVYGSYLQDRA
ncbi:hypothetical protein ACIQWN_00240 [Streptomyces vinaceus]|uniref:hypothetical protein n=1 Tax=Streptomyces vinaceus TaxID=1960 RepID=UPI00381F279D